MADFSTAYVALRPAITKPTEGESGRTGEGGGEGRTGKDRKVEGQVDEDLEEEQVERWKVITRTGGIR